MFTAPKILRVDSVHDVFRWICDLISSSCWDLNGPLTGRDPESNPTGAAPASVPRLSRDPCVQGWLGGVEDEESVGLQLLRCRWRWQAVAELRSVGLVGLVGLVESGNLEDARGWR